MHFQGSEYRAHTSCISEAQKYQGHLYRDEKKDKKGKGGEKRKSINGHDSNSQAMVPRKAYVEDAPDGEESLAVAVVDVPPRAPTPPQAANELPDSVNVFDFLVSDATPNAGKTALGATDETRANENGRHYPHVPGQFPQYQNGASPYTAHGFSYGDAPVQPSFSRYDSWQDMSEAQRSQTLMPPPPYVTPAPKEQRREKKEKTSTENSDKKRKRQQVEELDLSSAKRSSREDDSHVTGSGGRVLHSGLTGGLSKLVTDPDFYEDRINAGPTPTLSPIKRSKREDEAKKERRKSSYTSYSTTTSKPSSTKNGDDKQRRRSRSPDRKYHDDKHRSSTRPRSPDDRKHRTRSHRESISSDDRSQHRKPQKTIEYHYPDARPSRPASVQPNATNAVVSYASRADLFLSFVQKGPESESGCSINKVLKRYHRERDVRGEDKEDDDKELWKSLRLRRNERGEIVVFM